MLAKLVDRITTSAAEGGLSRRIGYLCGYVPQELIYAAGYVPVRLFESADKATVSAGDNYMQRNSCPFARGCIGNFLAHRYADLAGVVLGHTCDNIRGAAENIEFFEMSPFIHHLDVPRSPGRPNNHVYFARQLQGLRERLGALVGEEITNEKLTAAIDVFNCARKALAAVREGKHTGGVRPPWTDFIALLHTVMSEDPALFRESLDGAGGGGDAARSGESSDGPQVLLMGSVIPRGSDGLVRHLEAAGGSVVDDYVCTGSLYHDFSVEVAPSEEPLQALARSYVDKPSCARMHDIENRMKVISEKIAAHQVDGVLYVTLKFCDSHLYDVPQFKELSTRLGIPFLHIESELTDQDSGQLRTRIDAFFERIARRPVSSAPPMDRSRAGRGDKL
jgi:benzoyl-CoA reductase/2-hydroxyglutaryl-CoA dehydratase subunit BcrC/BadD/HgdB